MGLFLCLVTNVCGGSHSFSGDTMVETPDGDVPISEIEVGDTVLAYNEETGTIEEQTVTHTYVHEDEVIVTLSINGELIETTPTHPFYTDEGWVDAEDLDIGDAIVSLGGVNGIVDSILIEERTETMYDLTVEEVHTFAVGDGNWVVHNTNGDGVCGLLPAWSATVDRRSAAELSDVFNPYGAKNYDRRFNIALGHDRQIDVNIANRPDLVHHDYQLITFARSFQDVPTLDFYRWPSWMEVNTSDIVSDNLENSWKIAGRTTMAIDAWADVYPSGQIRFNLANFTHSGVTTGELKHILSNRHLLTRTEFYHFDVLQQASPYRMFAAQDYINTFLSDALNQTEIWR